MSEPSPQKRSYGFYAIILAVLTLWMSLPGIASIPVIDRDEARYAQATVQMIETSDYVNISFQDRARNKKPAGIYWMQAGFVKAFSSPEDRKIWAHRLPSILGGLIAVFATFWAGIVCLGRRGAFISAALLGCSALFVFESHVAKTDAMLCAMSAITLGSLIHMRTYTSKLLPFLFWGAMGVAIMVKGPILPALVILSCLSLTIWERSARWMKPLLNPLAICLCLLIILPWGILITMSTQGAFFVEAFTEDLAPKLVGAQEKHGAPPGVYLATLPIFFWPSSLFLICGFIFAGKIIRKPSEKTTLLGQTLRLLICWIVPFWILLELTPTKLPNYLLPTYPALALMCGGAVMAMLSDPVFKISRRVGAILFLIIAIILVTIILGFEARYAPAQDWTLGVSVIVILLAFISAGLVWTSHIRKGLLVGLATSVLLTPMVYQFILPRLETLFISHRIETALVENGIDLPRHSNQIVGSPVFTEPSLVYRLGTDIKLGDKFTLPSDKELPVGQVILLDQLSNDGADFMKDIRQLSELTDVCLKRLETIEGINYSKGDPVIIDIFQTVRCKSTPEIEASDPSQTPG